MEQRTPPSKKCEKCYYWRLASSNNDSLHVCHFCYETGKPRVDDDVFRTLVNEGYTVEQIAEKTQYHVKHVYERLRAIKRKEALA